MNASPSSPVASENPSPNLWQIPQEELLAKAVEALHNACESYKAALTCEENQRNSFRETYRHAAELYQAQAEHILTVYKERASLE